MPSRLTSREMSNEKRKMTCLKNTSPSCNQSAFGGAGGGDGFDQLEYRSSSGTLHSSTTPKRMEEIVDAKITKMPKTSCRMKLILNASL